ncbi:hypothetical protein F5I97DRAFT_1929710 [Phlebopus sp. FC_14]|nr:hypothetical protein F5I97DRAFT_1929710 [Phlebopus sp. FC_14]
MSNTQENMPSYSDSDSEQEATSTSLSNIPISVSKRKCKRGRKTHRKNPYPKWADDVNLEAIENECRARFFDMYASLPSRPKPQPQLSPISRLPTELLLPIFLRAIERPKSPKALPSQFILSAVCKTWHNAVMSSPELWGTLYVSVHMPLGLYRACVAKSAPFPLHVEFFGWSWRYYPLVEACLQVLKRERSRLHTVSGTDGADHKVGLWRAKYLLGWSPRRGVH